MALNPVAAGGGAAKAQALANFATAYHTGMAALHASAEETNRKMVALAASAGPNGFTPQQQTTFEALAAARRKLNRTISEYAMVHNIALNESADVTHLIGTVAAINNGLNAELVRLNGIVAVVGNVNGLIQTLTSVLTALAAVAAI